ncbi:MAG: single-stranded-DNA-specific exonuclease RecJ [Pirellulaceae bacterium]|nr:MAG: single-stranded-DNA-specific exonuclease RecJ [Pirellulaceae bacterium]
MIERRWTFAAQDRAQIEKLVTNCGLSPVLAQLLAARGMVHPAAVRMFLEARLSDLRPPERLPGLEAACQRIMRGIRDDESIVVYGDYDADGMTGTAILYRCIQLLGGKVVYYVPDRFEEGYGLHVDSVQRLAERGRQLIITVDCGVASVEAAQRAKELGVSLVVTDHHQFAHRLPDAEAIVHPALPGGGYPFPGLCGAGVALKVAWRLCQLHCDALRVTEPLRRFLMQSVGLAAIGTVADVVPLIDENRILVRSGLATLLAEAPVGVQKLLELTKANEKRALEAEDIAYVLAPRLNAAGRLGQARLGVELLVTEDPTRAEALANYVMQLNETRGKLERSIQLAAGQQLKKVHDETDPAFVLASPDWHPGVIGVVAGKLAERYHRPVVMIAMDKLGTRPGIGSARSPNGIDLHAALHQCEEYLASCGGHQAAAGLKIDNRQVDAFRAAFLDVVAEMSEQMDTVPELRIDAEAALGQLDLELVEQINRMGPFGMANPRPLFCSTGVSIVGEPAMLGDSGKHLALRLEQYGTQIRAVAFGVAEQWGPALLEVDGPVDVAYRPVINEFRGFRKVELHLVDWRPHTKEPQPPHRRPLSGTSVKASVSET